VGRTWDTHGGGERCLQCFGWEARMEEVKLKVKVKLPLCLTKHHAMKAYWGSGGIVPLIL
jgi:hypothetical protein